MLLLSHVCRSHTVLFILSSSENWIYHCSGDADLRRRRTIPEQPYGYANRPQMMNNYGGTMPQQTPYGYSGTDLACSASSTFGEQPRHRHQNLISLISYTVIYCIILLQAFNCQEYSTTDWQQWSAVWLLSCKMYRTFCNYATCQLVKQIVLQQSSLMDDWIIMNYLYNGLTLRVVASC